VANCGGISIGRRLAKAWRRSKSRQREKSGIIDMAAAAGAKRKSGDGGMAASKYSMAYSNGACMAKRDNQHLNKSYRQRGGTQASRRVL